MENTSFSDETQFRLVLWRTLVGSARKVLTRLGGLDSKEQVPSVRATFDPLSNWHTLIATDSEVNATVLLQQASTLIGETIRDMAIIAKAAGVLTRSVNVAAKKISAPTNIANLRFLAATVSSTTEALTKASRQFLEQLPLLHSHLQVALTSAQRAIGIFTARKEMTPEIAQSTLTPLSEMRSSYKDLVVAVRSARSAMDSLNSPGSALDIERRKLSALLDDTILVLEVGIDSMGYLEDSLNASL